MLNNDFILLSEQLDILKKLMLLPETDTTYLLYDNVDEFILQLEEYQKLLSAKDISALEKISFLFVPTGFLQDISIDSGWSNDFINIAYKVDTIIDGFKKA